MRSGWRDRRQTCCRSASRVQGPAREEAAVDQNARSPKTSREFKEVSTFSAILMRVSVWASLQANQTHPQTAITKLALCYGLTCLSTHGKMLHMEQFGKILRRLRSNRGMGIKRLAPDLGVTYSYLSKLEGGDVNPSEELVGRVSKYFGHDESELLLSAGKVPADVLEILRTHPQDAVNFLRERFGGGPSDA